MGELDRLVRLFSGNRYEVNRLFWQLCRSSAETQSQRNVLSVEVLDVYSLPLPIYYSSSNKEEKHNCVNTTTSKLKETY